MIKKLSLILLLTSALAACGQNNSIPESLSEVKGIVAKLDSAVTAMYGWEPRDSTYNHSIDTVVSAIMDQYETEHPDRPKEVRTEHAVQQQAYDEARVTWAEFKRLIDADKYSEALDLYEGENASSRGKNSGDFLVFLKHSTQRYVFFSQVLLPMMQEYKDADSARVEYINLLHLEKAMEDGTIAMNAETTGYVPEVYPSMVMDLGFALLADGKMDEAQNLFGDIANAIYLQTDDALYANFIATKYAASLYLHDEKPDWARASWEDFKGYLEENKGDYDEEELARCLEKIDTEISNIRNMQQ